MQPKFVTLTGLAISWVFGFGIVLTAACKDDGKGDGAAGCTKDGDCKGDRICVAGRCESQPSATRDQASSAVAPAASTPPSPAADSASSAAVSRKCPLFTIRNAKDDRGAPLWPKSNDFDGQHSGKGAWLHLPVGQAVLAACQLQRDTGGYTLCVRTPKGDVAWIAHDYLLGAGDPGNVLAQVKGLPACENKVCPAGECAP